MKKKLLRLCNKIYKSSFNFEGAIVILGENDCIILCLNRYHTVFLEISVDLDYFQGRYAPTKEVHFVHPEDVIRQELDLERELTEFEEAQLLAVQRLHHFFHGDYHHVQFKEFEKIAESDCNNVLIKCNGNKSMYFSHYLKEPLLDIPDTFGLNLMEDSDQTCLSMKYTFDWVTVNAVIAPRVNPPEESEIIFQVGEVWVNWNL